jgi:hypothetical protein
MSSATDSGTIDSQASSPREIFWSTSRLQMLRYEWRRRTENGALFYGSSVRMSESAPRISATSVRAV